jgi:hypothetical protein
MREHEAEETAVTAAMASSRAVVNSRDDVPLRHPLAVTRCSNGESSENSRASEDLLSRQSAVPYGWGKRHRTNIPSESTRSRGSAKPLTIPPSTKAFLKGARNAVGRLPSSPDRSICLANVRERRSFLVRISTASGRHPKIGELRTYRSRYFSSFRITRLVASVPVSTSNANTTVAFELEFERVTIASGTSVANGSFERSSQSGAKERRACPCFAAPKAIPIRYPFSRSR